MTSTDFAARYRLLKNVATRGARSFLAQQVALGRMVMVHYLDSETPEQRSATLARLDALKPPAREKLLEVVDVDGSPVAVTLFISSFADFATWLDQVSPAAAPQARAAAASSAPGEFTRMFSKMEAPAAPPVMAHRIEALPERQAPAAAPPSAPPPPPPAPKPAGDFTRIFGKMDVGAPTAEPAARIEPTPAAPAADELNSPTLIIEAPKVAPRAAASAPPPPPPSRVAEPEGGAGFTAIFGRVGETRLPDDLPAETPKPAAPVPGAGRVMQPPVPDFHQSTAPLPPPGAPPSPTGGEFTQLFQRLSATPASPPSAVPPAPPLSVPPVMSSPSFGIPSEMPRPAAPPGRADTLPPAMPAGPPPMPAAPMVLPPPSLGAPASTPQLASSLPAPMLGMSPPVMPSSGPRAPDMAALPNVPLSAPIAPPMPQSPWSAAPPAASPGSIFGGGAAQSEYTRILGRVVVPPPPPVSIQPPVAANAAAPGQKSKSMVPLIIALNILVLLTVAIVAYFVFRK